MLKKQADLSVLLLCNKPTPPYPRHIHGAGFLVGSLGNPIAGRDVVGLVLVQKSLIRAGRVESARGSVMHRGALGKDRFIRLYGLQLPLSEGRSQDHQHPQKWHSAQDAGDEGGEIGRPFPRQGGQADQGRRRGQRRESWLCCPGVTPPGERLQIIFGKGSFKKRHLRSQM